MIRIFNKITLLLVLLFLSGLKSGAQEYTLELNTTESLRDSLTYVSHADSVVGAFDNSMRNLRYYYENEWRYQGKDLLTNPYYSRLFFQSTLYDRAINQTMDNVWKSKYEKPKTGYSLLDKTDRHVKLDSTLNNMFVNFYLIHPELITTMEQEINNSGGIREEATVTVPIKHEVALADRVTPAVPNDVIEPVEALSPHRPNFWTFSARIAMSYQQTYQSNNWFQGQAKNHTLSLTGDLSATYNFNNKIIFSSALNYMLGFVTVTSDTVHSVQTNSDRIYWTNRLDVKAMGKWSYSFSSWLQTQSLPKYRSNSNHVNSDFMSPLTGNIGIGMSYGLQKKTWSLNAGIYPLSMSFTHFSRHAMMQKGRHFNETYGPNTTINFNWKVMKNVNLTSRFYYYTNFEKVQVELENTMTFTINKYISPRLYFYPRFDDTKLDYKGRRRIQIKEYFQLGFSYSFL